MVDDDSLSFCLSERQPLGPFELDIAETPRRLTGRPARFAEALSSTALTPAGPDFSHSVHPARVVSTELEVRADGGTEEHGFISRVDVDPRMTPI